MKNWILIAALPAVAIGAAALNSRGQQQPTTAPTTPPAQASGGNEQPPPPPRNEDRGPGGREGREGREDRDGRDGPGGRDGPMGHGGPGGPMMGGPGGPGGPGGGMGGRMGPGGPMDSRRPPSADMQRNYMTLVSGYVDLSRDSSASGIASVLTAADLLKPRGAAATIEYFTKLLPSVKDPAIDRAIRLQLVDLYRATNQSDEALKHLEKLITADAPAK